MFVVAMICIIVTPLPYWIAAIACSAVLIANIVAVVKAKIAVGNRSYEANWQANTYTITLNPNGGSVANTTITATYDQKYTLTDPEWTGHTFSSYPYPYRLHLCRLV